MLLPAVGFITLYLYFEPFPTVLPFFDCALQYSLCLIFPIYYIYFRLLTVDVKFSFKSHGRYLLIPILLGTTYLIGVLFTSWTDYTEWLTNENAFPDSSYIQFLNIMRMIIKIHFILQFMVTAIGNQLLIHKYGVKVEQFYSDMEEENYNNAKALNFSIVIIFLVSAIVFVLNNKLSLPKETLLYTVLSISSVMLFLIGYLGNKQKPINPTFEKTTNDDELNQLEVIPVDSRKKIVNKMLIQFEEEKIFLNNQLNIMDIVQAVGTNRTYISSIINQQFNQNFCSFVNSYRIVELERILLENPDYTNEILADCCGFGSLNSLKRALFAKTGMTLPEWKKQVLSVR
ncbi:MAG: AraC family transcriptional regulator [Paludibacter sp.]|nr:AraC family transcriptional regulator [Paludibacter sp.]